MKKEIINKVFFEKYYSGERTMVTCADLPLKDILPTDFIMINVEASFYSENNSYDGGTIITIYRPTLETDEEFEKRKIQWETIKEESKAKRFEDYKKLKKEFEP